LAWRVSAGTIRALIDLSGESYLAFRQMQKRVRAKQASSGPQDSLSNAKIKKERLAPDPSLDGPAGDAVLALIGLGYRRSVAENTIRMVMWEGTERAATPELVKLGLKHISQCSSC
jgi:Holliday junction resolvasome RuvABC DNA-binding subunit